jgi:hypothetical protein
MFFDNLKNQGYQVTFMSFLSKSVTLIEYGAYKYDHIIILAS